jgi:hypothetical protein
VSRSFTAFLRLRVGRLFAAFVLVAASTGAASAQVTPAAGYTPPDDTPSIKIGATLFVDYTYTREPTAADTDGNVIHPSAFNVGRSYINITGQISHLVAFRVTPDVVRDADAGALNGNLVFRVKYAFAQVNLDEYTGMGSWARFGIQQTPFVDYEEGIYRYRFQGTVFAEREGFLTSSDAGASFHYALPSNYGELHVGVYNGEGYSKVDPNNEKAIQIRGTIRPFAAGAPVLRGLRATGFYDRDAYVKNGERTRALGQVTFEHRFINAGFDFLQGYDQVSALKTNVEARGYSFFLTPRLPTGIEGLIRYDHLIPDTSAETHVRTRAIAGIAYWFPHQGSVSSALLLDYEQVHSPLLTPAAPRQKRLALHALINF